MSASPFELPTHPKLRLVQAVEVEEQGEPMVVLLDPAHAEPAQVLVSHAALALISLFDGRRDLAALQAEFERRYGERPEEAVLQDVIRSMDRALLLDSPRYRADLDARRAAYRAQPLRPMTLAPACFPESGDAAAEALASFYTLEDAPGRLPSPDAGPPCSGVVAPHIDYARGAALYAQAYLRLVEGLGDADLVVILGTDHRGELDEPVTLTRLDFETPFGRLRTHGALVDRLVETCGEHLLDNEIAHAAEHSVEFNAVMLHHALGPRAEDGLRILPVLCGPLRGRAPGDRDARLARWDGFLAALREELASRSAVVIAAADLAHLGPAFQTDPLDAEACVALEGRDRATLEHLAAGSREGFDGDVLADGNARQICSHTALQGLLRLLPGHRGEALGYRQCSVPNDPKDASRVTVAAMAFSPLPR